MVASAVQFSKAPMLIESSVSGSVTDTSAMHPLKAQYSIVEHPVPTVTVVRDRQY
jgi:hypothetical protein